MALTATQLDSVSEITGASYEDVEEAALEINAATETAIIADIATWNENRNAVDFEMAGGSDGVKLKAQTLLDAITERTRRRLGFTSIRSTSSGCSTSASVIVVW